MSFAATVLKNLTTLVTLVSFTAILAMPGQPQPKLKPELISLTFFQGVWSCDGKFSKDDRKISSDMTFQPDLEGAWIMVRHDDRPPNRFHAVEFWGFDKTTGRFVAVINDSFGSTRMFTSPGWQGDRLIWDGDALTPEKKPQQHFLFEKKGPHEFVVTFELSREEGGWKPIDVLTCTKK
jgi:hypothetical protein